MTRTEQILLAREERAVRQKHLLESNRKTLLCFTMNIPGEEKISPLVLLAFHRGMDILMRELPTEPAGYFVTAAGPEAYFFCGKDPQHTKEITCEIETSLPIGRLFDLDVFSPDGKKLSRSQRRPCIICGKSVDICAKSGEHTVQQARNKADEILTDFVTDYLADCAVTSLLEEVHLTPKPGLVDERNAGAHSDMDLSLFEKSAEALRDYFASAVRIGLAERNCMPNLQAAGLHAEQTMYAATGGINTHKGAIYAFGLILGAMGQQISFGEELFSTAAELATNGVAKCENSHGEQVRRTISACGARCEAESGFPHAKDAYDVLCKTGSPHRALLHLMKTVQDTNVLYRGGAEGLVLVQKLACDALGADEGQLPAVLDEMDTILTNHRLSPGGCADLLALALFLKKTDWIWKE